MKRQELKCETFFFTKKCETLLT